MRFSFIKIPQHRKFHLDPIYYDEAKEERRERERRIRVEMGLNPTEDGETDSSFEDRIKGKMRRRIKNTFEVSRSVRRKSNIRLVVILIALMALFYYLLHAGYDWYSQFM
ncbi:MULTISPECIES: hypothetical protein [Marinilabiliaceae]|uniref:Uncharacterized protein n=2 Tax=Marinilabiliaceae TaxID=558415 RepID=A0A1T5A2F1_9BACT|nr:MULTISPECIES: hypothetical protein [Marinilabiliaceae]ASB48898.1 hypothetical protein CDL62_06995 [Alkalitalea saponilacus]TCO10797.1 hypothetical protein EV194_101429 [Natronoflexus pectinivorans]SKB29035.1 hypothetical protein SAMN03080601_00038 [Alkalitalea saponilacus]